MNINHIYNVTYSDVNEEFNVIAELYAIVGDSYTFIILDYNKYSGQFVSRNKFWIKTQNSLRLYNIQHIGHKSKHPEFYI